MENWILVAVAVFAGLVGVIAVVKLQKPKELPKKQPPEVLEQKSEGSSAAELKPESLPESSVKADEPSAQKVAPAPIPADKKTLSESLSNTRQNLFGRLQSLWGSSSALDDDQLEEIEEVLYTSDLGPATVQRLMGNLHQLAGKSEGSDFNSLRNILKDEMKSIFTDLQFDEESITDSFNSILPKDPAKPYVLLVVGVNGAGKTTTIGKLAHWACQSGMKTLIAAGDTFRAAAGEQLTVWSERAQVDIFHPEGVKDPSAVAYQACEKAKTGEFDLVIIDTAGRLHTQSNLMEELKKMKRVIPKVIEGAPHETLIVLDANSGQNALIQAKSFHEALDLSGVVLTKLDGSAKGGVALGVAQELKLPVKLIGVGEGMEDLRPFRSQEFVDSII